MPADPIAATAPGADLPLPAARPAQAVVPVARRPRHPLLDTGRPAGRIVRFVLVVAALTGAVAAGIPLCPVAIVAHQPCPGCGLTRATLAMLHGHVAEASHLHPLVFIVTPVIGVAFAYNALAYLRRGQWFASESLRNKWITRAWLVLGVAMVTVWIARFFGAFGGPVPV